jgi:azurin
VRRAAIRAVSGLGKEPQAVFSTLVDLIKKDEQTTTAAQAIMQLPRAAWVKDQAGPAVAALLAWAGHMPASNRTAQDYIETVQVANELANLLPVNEASAARKVLRDLRVNVFVIKTLREQMRYDTPRLVVEAGKPFEVILENNDVMPHNLLFVEPNTRQAVAESVQTMLPTQLDKKGRAYVPQNDKRVLEASKLIEPGQKETLKLTAPTTEGDYEYVCTFPGHWMLMWGKLVVTKDVDAYLQAHPQPDVAPGSAAVDHHAR